MNEWKSLFPGDGLIRIGDNREVFTTSMFHQLRCLDILRARVVEVRRAKQSVVQPIADPLTTHCINYLREIVLCNMDSHLYAVVGGVPHNYICRDWERVYEALEKNQREE
ncbi:hypothetical protein D9758_017950 [Tetrapyrgos nigripes]|uniref:Uncharacterized protein n=1 Tax=Tetrapyrgos nigripes TaxID=182062 RepID=A0A8H5FAE1_9AGAR|nr:hypothetical protein D9758_017950 [Tetrapyrgos nigripes]